MSIRHCVWPTEAPPVPTALWDQKAWENFEDGFRPSGYTGGREDQTAWKAYLDRQKLIERAAFYALSGMQVFTVRFIHKISPKDTDVGEPIALPSKDLEQLSSWKMDSARPERSRHVGTPLAAALRRLGILHKGQRCHHRAENGGRKLVVFPSKSCWHSIILEQV